MYISRWIALKCWFMVTPWSLPFRIPCIRSHAHHPNVLRPPHHRETVRLDLNLGAVVPMAVVLFLLDELNGWLGVVLVQCWHIQVVNEIDHLQLARGSIESPCFLFQWNLHHGLKHGWVGVVAHVHLVAHEHLTRDHQTISFRWVMGRPIYEIGLNCHCRLNTLPLSHGLGSIVSMPELIILRSETIRILAGFTSRMLPCQILSGPLVLSPWSHSHHGLRVELLQQASAGLRLTTTCQAYQHHLRATWKYRDAAFSSRELWWLSSDVEFQKV